MHAPQPPNHMPPLPHEDEDWTTYPNRWDLEYAEWRAEIEQFARDLRDWWREQQAQQPIPMNKYEDGMIKFQWAGEMQPVSKRFYTWMHTSDLAKSDRAVAVLVDGFVTRGKYAAQRAQKK